MRVGRSLAIIRQPDSLPPGSLPEPARLAVRRTAELDDHLTCIVLKPPLPLRHYGRTLAATGQLLKENSQ